MIGKKCFASLAAITAMCFAFSASAQDGEKDAKDSFELLDLGGLTCGFRADITSDTGGRLYLGDPQKVTAKQLEEALKKSCDACKKDLAEKRKEVMNKGRVYFTDRCKFVGCTLGKRAYAVDIGAKVFSAALVDRDSQFYCKK